MVFRLVKKDFMKNWFINLLIVLLLVITFLAIMTVASAIRLKLQKYETFASYLEQKGYYTESGYLQKEDENGQPVLLRDAQELKEYLPGVDQVLSVGKIWEPYLDGSDTAWNAWCYSPAVVDILHPQMQEGRWFTKKDREADVLRAVVSYNTEGIKVGETYELSSSITDAKIKVQVIGIMKDRQSLFNADEARQQYGDYRDFYYTYDYEAEDQTPLLILDDGQILNEKTGDAFKYLNYRLSPDKGFQKQLFGGTLFTFDKGLDKADQKKLLMKFTENSSLNRCVTLTSMKKKSWDYILSEYYQYLPVLICLFVFVVIAAISANVITVKRQLRNYAIYYICGLSWKKCACISLFVGMFGAGLAFLLATAGVAVVQVGGLVKNTALQLGSWQLIGCVVAAAGYILLSWSVPLGIVRKTSAKEIMTTAE